jgi:periplasmic protein CpxP/Spy
MTKRTWIRGSIAVAAVVIVAAASVLVAAAAPRMQGRGGGFGFGEFGPGLPPLHMLAVALDMTEAQQQQAKSILDAHKTELQQVGQRARAAHEQVRTAVQAPEVNEQAIRSAVSALAQVQADGAVLRARVRQELLGVLTPEQRTKAAELENAMRNRVRGAPRERQRQGGAL